MVLIFLSFSKTQPFFVLIFKQFHNYVTALANTAVSFLSLNSKPATVYFVKNIPSQRYFLFLKVTWVKCGIV